MSIKKDIEYIKKSCNLVCFDSIEKDWILYNINKITNKNEKFPLYISVWNKYGKPWKPMKQSNENKDNIFYSNGSNVGLILYKENKKLYCDEFELFYKEISKKEYIKFYKNLAYRVLKEENLLKEMEN